MLSLGVGCSSGGFLMDSTLWMLPEHYLLELYLLIAGNVFWDHAVEASV